MNIEALSLTGEKEVLATAIYLIKQTLNDNSGTFETSLKNIYELFLHSDDVRRNKPIPRLSGCDCSFYC